MTRPDTNEIRFRAILDSSETSREDLVEMIGLLCDAYDEAQKEIEKLKNKEQVLLDIHDSLGVKFGEDPYAVIHAKDLRIITLEALLEKVLELDDGTKFFKYKNDLLLFCPLCFGGDEHSPECLSWEIKKELGEG